MSYVLSALPYLGALLAIGAVLWYIRRLVQAKDEVTSVLASNTAKDNKIQVLDQQVIDSETALRAQEKARNDKIVADHDVAAATDLLRKSTKSN